MYSEVAEDIPQGGGGVGDVGRRTKVCHTTVVQL